MTGYGPFAVSGDRLLFSEATGMRLAGECLRSPLRLRWRLIDLNKVSTSVGECGHDEGSGFYGLLTKHHAVSLEPLKYLPHVRDLECSVYDRI